MGLSPTNIAVCLLLVCCWTGIMQIANALGPAPGNFADYYEAQWGEQHIQSVNNGAQVNLILDQTSGAGFNSKKNYIYGYFSIKMKLIPGFSAGTVTAFFISSPAKSSGDTHDEIDMEFLGNTTGSPYSLSTNLFANGQGGREQKVNLWFDPTADFHEYSIIWNHFMVTWRIDGIPFRVFKNVQSLGLPYPGATSQPAQAIGVLFDGSSWATQHGNTFIPVDYSFAPFIPSYTGFVIDACENNDDKPDCETNYQNNWWEASEYTDLSADEVTHLKYIQANYIYYDYCKDTIRYPNGNPECSYNYN
jgi:xyloglucan:xyloglucosyl transferase